MFEKYVTLIQKAESMYGFINPCGGKYHFEKKDFTIEHGFIFFWFNTVDNSTHIISDNL